MEEQEKIDAKEAEFKKADPLAFVPATIKESENKEIKEKS